MAYNARTTECAATHGVPAAAKRSHGPAGRGGSARDVQPAVALAHEHALYTGDLSLITQRWADLQKHSFVNFFNSTQGLVVKSPALMGQKPACECPASWSPAGLPPGVYEATHCSCDDLIDWPAQYRDGYVSANNTASAVPNAYIALAADRMSQMARWLGKDADAVQYAHISTTILIAITHDTSHNTL